MARYEKPVVRPVVVVEPPKKLTLYQIVARNTDSANEIGARNEINDMNNVELVRAISEAMEEM